MKIVSRNDLTHIEQTFFRKKLKEDTLGKVRKSYETIKMCAAAIHDHSQKQDFLKVLYEEFYKAYNPKKADKQGIVYTPMPVVKFMVNTCDYLLHEVFGRTLSSKNVNVLDPCTGTGVFITQIIKHLEGDLDNLKYKYANELHCNEMDLLPYYVANLNIEYIYKQIAGSYEEFENLCLVDTLDNIFDKSHDLLTYAGISEENLDRVKRQNDKRISIIIGNPPYNAHQKNVNEQNKNRTYPVIDGRIKKSYLAPGVQKFKYDMYVRFVCWASQRIDKNGIVAFITNNSFMNARSLGGMRASLLKEFSRIYIVNLRGDAVSSGDLRRAEGGNIFENKIKEGVAISFFIRDAKHSSRPILNICEVDAGLSYFEKKAFVEDIPFKKMKFHPYKLDSLLRWVRADSEETGYSEFVPIIDKFVKSTKIKGQETAIFKSFANGMNSARDDWAYDFGETQLRAKIKYFASVFNKVAAKAKGKSFEDASKLIDGRIKWSRDLINRACTGVKISEDGPVIDILFRPFSKRKAYYGSGIIDVPSLKDEFFSGKKLQCCDSD